MNNWGAKVEKNYKEHKKRKMPFTIR